MSFQIEKLPDIILEQIFEYCSEHDTDFYYSSKTNKMNFYFPVAHLHSNVMDALKNWMDRKSFIHKDKCSKSIKPTAVYDENTATCGCDKRVLVYSGNGGENPLDFIRGESEKIVVELHSTQQIEEYDGDQDLHWGDKDKHFRRLYPQTSGIAQFYEFGPITNFGALSSSYIGQLDVYHGVSGKNFVSFKHPLLDKILEGCDQGESENNIFKRLSEREKLYYDVQFEEDHHEFARQFNIYCKKDVFIESTSERGFFRRLPHKNFKPLKHIKFHRFITTVSSSRDGELNGILFSNDTENVRSKLKLINRQHFKDPHIVRAKDSYTHIQTETLASDDMEPYQTNPVEWSRTLYRVIPNTWLPNEDTEYCNDDVSKTEVESLSDSECFAYADAIFYGFELKGVRLFKMKSVVIQ